MKITTKLYLQHLGCALLISFISLIIVRIIIGNTVPSSVVASVFISAFSIVIWSSIKEAYSKGLQASRIVYEEANKPLKQDK